ncbi:hypothetical protein B0H14DRAFT_2635341 [Mycena olivaceomarginata]|nr:hypothetical protein B0H14DRAFT_2635341 [Mycena olivaceomarginata]
MQVNENRRQIRELTEDVVVSSTPSPNLPRVKKTHFGGQIWLSAVRKSESRDALCSFKVPQISAVQLPGLRGFRSQFKAWRKRDDLEAKIGHLKEHAFSVARIEHNTLRIDKQQSSTTWKIKSKRDASRE